MKTFFVQFLPRLAAVIIILAGALIAFAAYDQAQHDTTRVHESMQIGGR